MSERPTQAEIDQLRIVASAATQGEWKWGATHCPDQTAALELFKANLTATKVPNDYFFEVFLEDGRRTAVVGNGPTSEANSRFIATFSPQTILKLLDAMEANASHEQGVEERMRVAELIEHYQLICHANLPMSGGEAIHEFIAKLRAKDAATIVQLGEEVARLNKWADSFSDAQIKERQTGEMYQRELREEIASLKAQLAETQKCMCDCKTSIAPDDIKRTYCSSNQMMASHKSMETNLLNEIHARCIRAGLQHATGGYVLLKIKEMAASTYKKEQQP